MFVLVCALPTSTLVPAGDGTAVDPSGRSLLDSEVVCNG